MRTNRLEDERARGREDEKAMANKKRDETSLLMKVQVGIIRKDDTAVRIGALDMCKM